MASVTLLSLNIERSKHLESVAAFLKERVPDVVTLQECMQRDVPMFEKILRSECFFTPLNDIALPGELAGIEGNAIFARQIISAGEEYYAGEHDPFHLHTEDTQESIARIAKALSHVQLEKDGTKFYVATTHFTWTPKGEANDAQLKDLQGLFQALQKIPECILTGDFNAPRGRETWDTITQRYKDNIPARYTSTIDPMHRAGELPYVVDGLFTSPHYQASEVELHEGLSDHKAITAIITKM